MKNSKGQTWWNVFDAASHKLICQMTGKEDGSDLYDPRINPPKSGAIFQIATKLI